MALVGRKFRAILIGMVATLLFAGWLAMPVGAQNNADDQYDDPSEPSQGCKNPVEVRTFSGTENELTDPFPIRGNTFRLRYETEVTSNGAPELEVDVLDESGEPIGQGFLAFDGEDGSENILAGPGNFSLDIRANRVSYTLIVEDCAPSTDNGGNNNGGNDDNPPGDDNIINIPQKPLPPTGGPAILMPAGGLLLGAGLMMWRIIRRR